jgi:hypothetical protein
MPSRAYIGAFGFKGPDQQKKAGVLSGGERNRLNLALTLKEGGNVLLLDEPTNDLDTETLGSLENALLEFPGCAVVISHDRWFLDRDRHAHPGVGGRRGRPEQVVLVRGQLRVLREEQGRAARRRRRASAPRHLPQAHPRLSGDRRGAARTGSRPAGARSGSRWAGLAFGATLLLSVWVLFGPTNPGDGPFPGADKVVHVVLFALLAGTARWSWVAPAPCWRCSPCTPPAASWCRASCSPGAAVTRSTWSRTSWASPSAGWRRRLRD